MSYYFMIATCLRCHLPFISNPDRVPTIRIKGEKEPLCEDCFNLLNIIRMNQNLAPWEMPEGAYSIVNEETGEYISADEIEDITEIEPY